MAILAMPAVARLQLRFRMAGMLTGEPRPKEVTMVRFIITTILALCVSIAVAAEDTPKPAVPAEGQTVTCPLGNVPGSGQGQKAGQKAGQEKGQCLRKRDGNGACQGQGAGCGKGQGKGQGQGKRLRDGSCLTKPADG